MNATQSEFLTWQFLPARLNTTQAAWFLGFESDEITVLAAANLLKPLGYCTLHCTFCCFGEDGKPIPVIGEAEPTFAACGLERGRLRLRGHSQEFRPTAPATPILQLRALFGINVRCEIVLYLLTHEFAHPSQIAREAYYFERAVQGTLVDMSRSGVIQVRATGREKHYWLQPLAWRQLLNRTGPAPLEWITWPPLCSALEQIWSRLRDDRLYTFNPLLQASEVRQLMLRACLKNGMGPATRDFSQSRGGETGASPQWAVTVEPTKALRKRPVARRVFTKRAGWLRCSSVTDRCRVCSLVAPRHPALFVKTGPIRFFRQALRIRPALERAGFDRVITDDRLHLGEAYLPVFIQDVRKLLEHPHVACGQGTT